MTNQQPVALNVAIAGLVASAISVATILWPDRLSPELQASIIAFANAAIVVVTIVVTRSQVTPIANPTLKAGTSVNVQGSEDKVVIESSPPGPVGVEGDAA
jgi:hypothetical protein